MTQVAGSVGWDSLWVGKEGGTFLLFDVPGSFGLEPLIWFEGISDTETDLFGLSEF